MADSTGGQQDNVFSNLLGANLVTLMLVLLVVFVFRAQIQRLVESLLPDITVPPSDVEVVVPEASDAYHNHIKKHLINLTYSELSTLVNDEMTSFLRMHNHYKTKPSTELKDRMIEMAARLDTILAYREEAWLHESRQLGERSNAFSPLGGVLKDLINELQDTVVPTQQRPAQDRVLTSEPPDD